jgi:hypothetical protein
MTIIRNHFPEAAAIRTKSNLNLPLTASIPRILFKKVLRKLRVIKINNTNYYNFDSNFWRRKDVKSVLGKIEDDSLFKKKHRWLVDLLITTKDKYIKLAIMTLYVIYKSDNL